MTEAVARPAASPGSLDDSVEAMRRYYVQRASTYERVYHKPERQDDLRAMEAWVAEAFRDRRVIELAAGTGWWTPHGARHARQWLATDLNPQTWAVAQPIRQLPTCVRFSVLDAYAMDMAPLGVFDGAFAGCWWSHVPLSRLPGWLDRLHRSLQPGARVVFLDNSFVQARSTPISRRDAEGNTYQLRTLDDGSTHEVLKNFPSREQALQLIGPRTRAVQWLAFTHYWILSYELDGAAA